MLARTNIMRIVQRRISLVLLGFSVLAFGCRDGAPTPGQATALSERDWQRWLTFHVKEHSCHFICARLVNRRIRVEILRGGPSSIKVNRRGYDVIGVLGKGSEAR